MPVIGGGTRNTARISSRVILDEFMKSISAGVSVHGEAFNPCSNTIGRCQFSRPANLPASSSSIRFTVESFSVCSVCSTIPGRGPATNVW